MNVLVIDCGSTKVPHFGKIVKQFGGEATTVKISDWQSIYVSGQFDGIIISGAPILLTNTGTDEYLEQFSLLEKVNVPVLGVCFGHQIMGLLEGAEIYLCEEDRNWQTIQIKEEGELFKGINKEGVVQMMQDHTEAITLSPNFELLGSSAICEVEAVKHKTKLWFGVQFHPEVSGTQGEQLIGNFLELL